MSSVIPDDVYPQPMLPLVVAWRTGKPVSDADYIYAHCYLVMNPHMRSMLPEYRALYGFRSGVDRDRLWVQVRKICYPSHPHLENVDEFVSSQPKVKEVEPCRQPPTSSRLQVLFVEKLRRLASQVFSRTNG